MPGRGRRGQAGARCRRRPRSSPRSAFRAFRSMSISRIVRNPIWRRTGSGGHQPWTACWSREGRHRARQEELPLRCHSRREDGLSAASVGAFALGGALHVPLGVELPRGGRSMRCGAPRSSRSRSHRLVSIARASSAGLCSGHARRHRVRNQPGTSSVRVRRAQRPPSGRRSGLEKTPPSPACPARAKPARQRRRGRHSRWRTGPAAAGLVGLSGAARLGRAVPWRPDRSSPQASDLPLGYSAPASATLPAGRGLPIAERLDPRPPQPSTSGAWPPVSRDGLRLPRAADGAPRTAVRRLRLHQPQELHRPARHLHPRHRRRCRRLRHGARRLQWRARGGDQPAHLPRPRARRLAPLSDPLPPRRRAPLRAPELRPSTEKAQRAQSPDGPDARHPRRDEAFPRTSSPMAAAPAGYAPRAHGADRRRRPATRSQPGRLLESVAPRRAAHPRHRKVPTSSEPRGRLDPPGLACRKMVSFDPRW